MIKAPTRFTKKIVKVSSKNPIILVSLHSVQKFLKRSSCGTKSIKYQQQGTAPHYLNKVKSTLDQTASLLSCAY